MTSYLVIVVIDEGEGVTVGHETPAGTPVDEPLELVPLPEAVGQLESVLELGHAADAEVFAGLDGLSAQVDDFRVDERASSSGESFGGRQVSQRVDDELQVTRPHVLGSINTVTTNNIRMRLKQEIVTHQYHEALPESGNTKGDALVEELDDFASDVRTSLVKVRHAAEFAVADLLGVAVVVDVSVRARAR